MTFLRKKKDMEVGAGLALPVDSAIKMTDEKMVELEQAAITIARQKKVDQILAKSKTGEARKNDREAQERADAITSLHVLVKRQQKEQHALDALQRFYRGHLGRKAAQRWALKKAELVAAFNLLTGTAICVQRIFRGYRGRCLAIRTRRMMAYFISLMREQEAADDEAQYWDTHAFHKFKKEKADALNKHFRSHHRMKVNSHAKISEDDERRMRGDEESSDDDSEDDVKYIPTVEKEVLVPVDGGDEGERDTAASAQVDASEE